MSKKVIQMSPLSLTIALCASGLFFSHIGDITKSFAQSGDPTQSNLLTNMVVPYEGYLMLDSTPLTGTQEMKFTLYDDASAGNAVWIETQTVTLNGGRFSVGLGTGTKDAAITSDFKTVILDGDKLYLGISVFDANANAYVNLSGRQAIEAAPYSAWSANSADFNVQGKLSVGSDANITGNAVIDGDVTTKGRYRLGATGKSAMRVSTTSDAVVINPSATFADGTIINSAVSITGATAAKAVSASTLTTTGDITVGDDLILNDNLTVKGDRVNLGVSAQRALYRNSSDHLYLSPSQEFPSVRVGTDLWANYDFTVLGDSTLTGNASIGGTLKTTGGLQTRKVDVNFRQVADTGTVNLGYSTSNSICFLSFIKYNASTNRCAIDQNSSGQWTLEALDDGSLCRATCVQF